MTAGANPARSGRRRVSSRLVVAAVLAAAAVVFIVQNNEPTAIRILVPVITMPLWTALAGVLIVGVVIGYALNWRRQ